MAAKNELYIDTSAFIAALDRSDSYHPLFARLFSDPPRLITSILVIAEGHAWFLKRYDTTKAIQFLNFIEDLKILKVESAGQAEIREASKLIRKFSDQNLSLTDAVGLYVMQCRRIKLCWSTDRHLALTGIPLVIHQ